MTNSNQLEWFQALLQQAAWAPSGDNYQIWKFTQVSVSDDLIAFQIEVPPESFAQQLFFDSNWGATYASWGTLCLNLELLLSKDGWRLDHYEFTDHSETTTQVVRIQFRKSKASLTNVLSSLNPECIAQRESNRSFYTRKKLPDQIGSFLERVSSEFTTVSIRRIAPNWSICWHAGMMDLVRFRQRQIFDSLLDALRFGDEVEKTKQGLDIASLDVWPHERLLLRLFRKFRWLLNLTRVLLVDWMAAFSGGSARLFFSGEIIFLNASLDGGAGWFEIGRALQSIWLKATELNMGLQIWATHLISYQLYHHNGSSEIDAPLRKVYLKHVNQLNQMIEVNDRLPVIGLRVGFPHRTHSIQRYRMPVQVEGKNL